MDVLIIGAVLIMSCVIIGVTLSEMQRLNKECDDLRKELEKVETQRDAENTRHKSLQKALSTTGLKLLRFNYCMRYDEMKDLEEKYQGMGEGARRLKAQQVIMPQVMTEIGKRITESFDARRQETTYAVDIWVRSQ